MHQRDALDAVLFIPPEVRLEHDAPLASKRSRREPRFPPGDFAVPFPGLRGLSVPLPALVDGEAEPAQTRPQWQVRLGDEKSRTWVGEQGFSLSHTAACDLWAAEEDPEDPPLCAMPEGAPRGQGPLGPWTSGAPRWPTLPMGGLTVVRTSEPPPPAATTTTVAPTASIAMDFPEEDGLDRLPLVGLDCEMVRTAAGLELARVSCVSPSGKVLLDTFVKPMRQVEDYLTRWSGVTPSSLENVTTRLANVQAALCRLLDARPGCFLVGHSLECDLAALRVYHTRILDTSLLYPHRDGPPKRSSLKFLAQHFLGRSIQVDDASAPEGHCSVEDARAAMDLALLKLSQGPGFGNLHGNPSMTLRGASLLRAAERRTEHTVRMVGPPQWLAAQADEPSLLAERYPIHGDHCGDRAIRKLQEVVERCDATAPHTVSVAKATVASQDDSRAVDSALRDLQATLPRYSLLLVLCQGTSPSVSAARPPWESPLDPPQPPGHSRKKRPREEDSEGDEPPAKRSASVREPLAEIRWGMSFLGVVGESSTTPVNGYNFSGRSCMTA